MEKLREPVAVTKSFLPPLSEFVKELERIWDSHWLTNNGQLHSEFSSSLQDYLNTQNVSLLVNGHMALETAIKALGLTGEVITTPFTFASTTHAIVNCGLTPIFSDINLTDYNIDVTRLEELITERTSAIIPVHVFGTPCDVDKIEEIANRHHLRVLYDAAHAFGVTVNGVGIGNFGDISMFSLHATKVFHAIEGGVLTYSNPRYKQYIDLYKNFGISGPETVEMPGINAKMNELQAAMGIVNLRHIESEIQMRQNVTNRYREQLSQVPGISFLEEKPGVRHNYAYLPVLIDRDLFRHSRDKLHESLKDYNIFTRKYFYPLTTDYYCYKDATRSPKIDNAKFVAERVLTLPIYSSLPLQTVDNICDAIKEVHQGP